MSVNYSADLQSRVEPCVFGGTPDCSQCGCAISSALHWIRTIKLAGPVKIDHFVRGSIGVGTLMNRLRSHSIRPSRWPSGAAKPRPPANLVQILALKPVPPLLRKAHLTITAYAQFFSPGTAETRCGNSRGRTRVFQFARMRPWFCHFSADSFRLLQLTDIEHVVILIQENRSFDHVALVSQVRGMPADSEIRDASGSLPTS